VSYGTYLRTVFAQRHPTSVRSIVLSSAFPLRFDMWARANAHAMRLAIRRVCARSTTGKCDGARTLRQLGRLARRLRAKPIPYRVDGERRILDDTALAGIAYWADVDIGQLPAIVRAALRGDTGPLIAAAGALSRFNGSQVPGVSQNLSRSRSRSGATTTRRCGTGAPRLRCASGSSPPAAPGLTKAPFGRSPSPPGRARSPTAATPASAGPTATDRRSAPQARSPTYRSW
jgi:hypothetical protein